MKVEYSTSKRNGQKLLVIDDVRFFRNRTRYVLNFIFERVSRFSSNFQIFRIFLNEDIFLIRLSETIDNTGNAVGITKINVRPFVS